MPSEVLPIMTPPPTLCRAARPLTSTRAALSAASNTASPKPSLRPTAPFPQAKSSRSVASDRLRTEMPRRALSITRLPRVSRRAAASEPARAPLAAMPLARIVCHGC